MTQPGPLAVAAAMRVTQEFGPSRARPRSIRLRERHPEIPDEMHAALFEICDRVEDEAYGLGRLSDSHPHLPSDVIERAIGQGTYVLRGKVSCPSGSAAEPAALQHRERVPGRIPGSPVVSGAESFLAGTSGCRIEVAGIDALYDEYSESRVLYGPDTVIEEQPWGTREFPVLDLERNLITFFERQ